MSSTIGRNPDQPLSSTTGGDAVPPPTEASPLRRAFHTMVAVAGWVLFVYWWWLVFQRVSTRELRFTAMFVGLSLVVVVLATAAWAWHNFRIYRRRGPRRSVRAVQPRFARDRVGRAVSLAAPDRDLRRAPVVIVRVAGLGKSYDAAAEVPPRTPGERGKGT